MKEEDIIRRYTLSGGSQVTVIRPFKGGVYAALVEMQQGEYPAPGELAINRNRQEQIYLIDGSLTVKFGERTSVLNTGQTMLLTPNTPYHLSGSCRTLVIVEDQADGTTEIVPD